jgi:hypothetical protein
MTAEQVQAIAAIATFFTAGLAVWAAFKAPKLAADFAEGLRIANLRVEEQRRRKLILFATLLENRGSMATVQSVSAINLTDLVFADVAEVREARKDFMEAANAESFEVVALYERYLGLIRAIARDLGLQDSISIADIRSAWLPTGLGEQAELEQLERQQKLAELRRKNES